jgi:hypothetical protein
MSGLAPKPGPNPSRNPNNLKPTSTPATPIANFQQPAFAEPAPAIPDLHKSPVAKPVFASPPQIPKKIPQMSYE